MMRNLRFSPVFLCALLLFAAGSTVAQPKIASFSPSSGPVGTVVTITGSGFNATPAGNIVYMGDVQATVTAGTATSLTITVPGGTSYKPIMVLNTGNGLAGSSSIPFATTFTNPLGSGIPANFYSTAINFNNKSSSAVATADLDRDGNPDIITLSSTGVDVVRNISATGYLSTSSFTSPVSLPGTNLNDITLGDIDGDGKLDIIAVGYPRNVTIWKNNSSAGTITAASFSRIDLTTGQYPFYVAVGDLDGDGKPEIATCGPVTSAVTILRNTSVPGTIDGSSFTAGFDILAGGGGVAINDLDGDRKPEIILLTSGLGVAVLRNIATPGSLGASSFESRVTFSVGPTTPYTILVGDLDGDGKPDIANATYTDHIITVLRNTSVTGSINDNSFAAHIDYHLASNSGTGIGAAIGDVDGDGKADLVASDLGGGGVSVFRNLSSPGSITATSFAPPVTFPISTYRVTTADLDSDGIPEILASGGSSILRINNRPIQPVISSFSPSSGPIGTTLVISGTGFDTLLANNIVSIGGVKAAVTAGNSTMLKGTVPAGTTYTPISVLNNATGLAASSSKPFITTFTNPFGNGIPANFYLSGVSLYRASYPYMAISDLDGDGKPDIVGAGGSGIAVFRNMTAIGSSYTGSFSSPIVITGSQVAGIALGDMDGDGKLDIVSISGTQMASVWKNNTTPGSVGAASFSRTDFTTGYYPMYVKVGDLDGDGKPEILTASLPSSSVTILRNTGKQGIIDASSFAAGFDLRIGGGAFAINDLDGDGKPELISSNGGLGVSRNLSVPGRLNAGSFDSKVLLTNADPGPDPVISDIDSDGKPDIVFGSYSATSVAVIRNQSASGSITAASFAPPVSYPLAGGSPAGLAVNDLDGDGKPDIACNVIGGVSVLRNVSLAGSITISSFTAGVRFSLDIGALASADLDGDGIPEIISSNGISVLRINNAPQQPVITSFVPASGPAGTYVKINGLNFNPAAASNTVYFGAVKAVVTASSVNSLIVIVPAGATHMPVSVLNRGNNLIGYSPNPFNITFSNPAGTGAVPANFYSNKAGAATGTLPYQAVLGDLDRDGKPDMVVVNETANTISIFINRSLYGTVNDSSFTPKIDLSVGADPRAVAIGDLNVDGQPDIAVVSSATGTVTVFTSLGFESSSHALLNYNKTEYPAGNNPFSIAIGDLDGDGLPDIVTANLTSGTVSALRNTYTYYNFGAPSFAPKTDFAAGDYPRSVAVSDFDGDGKADIAVANERSNTVSVLRSTAVSGVLEATSFAPMQPFATGASPDCITTSDVDRDGKPDLVVCNYGSSTVSVLRNTAIAGTITPASFAEKVDFPTGAQPFFVVAAEINGDGRPDLLTANSASGSLSVLRNLSVAGSITASSFDTNVDFATGGYPVGVAAGDLDGDGISELVSADAATNSVLVLSFSSPGHPAITSFTPERGPAGTTATILGANFNATPSKNAVYFGAVKAAVTGGSSTSLTVTVPAGATYQPVSVLDTVRGFTGYSAQPFLVTFANPFGTGIPADFYRPKTDFALSGPFTYAVALGDLNSDGKPDMVAVNEKAGTVSVLRNVTANGSLDAGSFAGRVDFPTAPAPRSVAIADIDGDGRLDVIVVSPASYTISILRKRANTSTTFSSTSFIRTDLSTGAYITAFAVGDLDDDGKPDLVYTNPYSGTVSVRRNVFTAGDINSGFFADPVDFTTGDFPRSVVISDIDGDGKPEIIVANERSGNVSVLRNTGRAGYIDAGSFAAKVDFVTGANPPAVTAGDVDGDGKPDLVVASYSASTVSVLRNTSIAGFITASSFAPKADFATGSNPFSIAIGDADGDGRPDLLTPNATANTISVLRNTGTAGGIDAASFAGKQDFGAGGYPLHLALGDLDGDGIAEVAVANAASGAISVLKVNSTAGMTATAAAGDTYIAAAEQTQLAIELYPNPTKGVFSLQLRRFRGAVVNLELLNGNGTAIEKRTVNTTGGFASADLSLRNQPAGIYYVKVTSIDGVQIVKVMVQR